MFIVIIVFLLLKFDLPCSLLTLQLSEVNDFQVASPLQYQSINKRAGDENTDTDQLKDVILPNIKFSKPVLSAAPAKSGPLDFPSEKSFLLFFAHEKGLGHMFQK